MQRRQRRAAVRSRTEEGAPDLAGFLAAGAPIRRRARVRSRLRREPGRAERTFARYDVATVLKKFFAMKIDYMIAPPGVEFIDFLEAPSSPLPWISEEELGRYTEKFQKSGFTGPLNYYRMMDTNWKLTAPWQSAKITVPVKFIGAEKDVGMQAYRTREYIKSEAFKCIVPDLEVIVIEGYHFLQQEQAERVSSEILSYLDKFTGEEI